MAGITTSQAVPAIAQVAIADKDGNVTPVWYQFFVSLWQRTGGAGGSISPVLDTITSSVGSMLYRAAGGWAGLAASARYKVLRMGPTVPEWDTLDGNSFGPQNANAFFVGPSTGAASAPVFRSVATADLVSVAGAIPGVAAGTLANAGNIGEYDFISVAPGAAVALTSATPTDVAVLALGPGDWDVWANVGIVPAGGASTTILSAWISKTSATDPGAPNGGAYVTQAPAAGVTAGQVAPVGSAAIQVSVAGNVFLSCSATFSGGTLGVFGFIGARRRR